VHRSYSRLKHRRIKTMIFDRITLHNYGVYLGRQEIKLQPEDNEKPIILIGGLNGVGKTTLLDAFQLGLFGKLSNLSNKGSLAYDKYLKNCIHKSVNPSDGAAIKINFRHQANGKEHSYEVTRSWKQNRKNVSESVVVIRDGKTDPVLTESWNEYVEQFLPIRISSLFFFDGEKIKDLADFKKSSEIVATGINQLLGLDLVDRLLTDLVVLEKRKTLTLSDHHEQKKIELFEENLLDLNTKRAELAQQKNTAEETIKEIQQKIDEIDEQFRLEGGDLYREREMLEYKKDEARKRTREIEQKLVDIASESMPLVLVEPLLNKILDQARNEEKARLNEQLNGTLKERDKYIVGELKKRKMPNEVLTEIRKILNQDIRNRKTSKDIKKYLNLDAETIDTVGTLLQESLSQECLDTLEMIENMNKLKIETENLDRKLAQVPDTEAIAQIVEKKEELIIDLREAQVNLDILVKEYDEIQKKVSASSSDLEKEYQKELDAEYSRETASRIIAHSTRSRETLEIFKQKVIEYHLDRIQGYILNSFKELLRKKTLVTDIRFDPKTFNIDVIGPNNKSIDINRLSAGEKQLLSVSLLWGLAQASGRRLPAIIDTPLGRLDATHRTHLVKRYFPQASHQVLLLSTDEEINEKYYRMIKPWVSQTYHLEFDDLKQTTTVKPGYFW
jgi:DNA sulfur modification protein DndD